jgi:hypothetical protein
MSTPVAPAPDGQEAVDSAELRDLYHRLSNELGIILAHAELLEARAPDASSRGRACQVVAAVVRAMSTVRELRSRVLIERAAAASNATDPQAV